MEVMKCKMCGGNLEIEEGMNVAFPSFKKIYGTDVMLEVDIGLS